MLFYAQAWLITRVNKMKLIAITGSIGCGKTTLAGMIRRQGYVVFDVDSWVRRLYFNKDFIRSIGAAFPGTVDGWAVDKRKLRNIVFNDRQQLKILESMTHPFLCRYLKRVINKNSGCRDLFFLDVALLFEMGWQKYCDRVVVADVPYEVQKRRVMERDNVGGDDFDKINNVQMSNRDKKLLADLVINTDKPKNLLKLEVLAMLDGLEKEL